MQVTSSLNRFFSGALQVVLQSMAIAPEDFFKVAKPELLAGWLAKYPEQRGAILFAAGDLNPAIGSRRVSPQLTTDIISLALTEETEEQLDPTLRKPSVILQSVAIDDWPTIVPHDALWSIILSGEWYKQALEGTEAIIERIASLADECGLLSADEKLRAITPARLVKAIPAELRDSLLVLSLTEGLAKNPLPPQDVFRYAPNMTLVTSLGVESFVQLVFGAIATKYALVKKESATVTAIAARSGNTTPPPPPVEVVPASAPFSDAPSSSEGSSSTDTTS